MKKYYSKKEKGRLVWETEDEVREHIISLTPPDLNAQRSPDRNELVRGNIS